MAKKIINCESGFDPNAKNPKTPDFSYWQINKPTWDKILLSKGWDLKNPDNNLEAGFWILSTEGTKPWKASYPCIENGGHWPDTS